MNDLEALSILATELNSTNSSKLKLEILAKHPECKKILFYVYNSFYQYGVSPENCKKRTYITTCDIVETDMCSDVYELLDALRTRKATGHYALRACNSFADNFPDTAEMFWRVLDRDIKCRIDAKAINKVFPNLIPTFDVALADKYDPEKSKVAFDGSFVVSRKLDGVRCITVVNSLKDIRFYSRAGHEFMTLQRVREAFEKLGESIVGKVFDGEMCIVDENGLEDFTAVVGEIKRKNSTIERPVYKLFDCLTNEEFFSKKSTRTLFERHAELNSIIPKGISQLNVLEQTLLTEESMQKMLEEAKSNGWEGLILRRADVGYVGKRSKDMLKVKEFHDDEYVIEDVEMGIKPMLVAGKMQDTMCLAAVKISHKGNEVSVGSGWSDEQRLKYFSHPEELIGKTITVKYFAESKDRDGKLSLRFPIMKHLYTEKRNI